MAARIERDAADKTLVRRLQQDGRASYTDLGKEVGLSAPAVRARVQRLADRGLLEFAAVTNPMKRGLPVMALFGIKIDDSLPCVVDELKSIDSVVHLVSARALDS